MAINPLTGRDDELEKAFAPLGFQPGAVPVPAPSPADLTHAREPNALDAVKDLKAVPLPPPELPPVIAPNAPARPLEAPAAPTGPILAGSQVTSKVARPELTRAASDIDQVAKDAEKTAREQARVDAERARDDYAATRLAEQDVEDAQIKADERKAKIQLDLDKGKTYLENKSKEYDDYKVTDFFEDRGVGTKVLASLAMGLGAYGASFNGGQNSAMSIIDSAVARDRANKLNQQEKLLGQKKDAGDAVKDNEARLVAADVELRAQHDTLYKQLERQRAANLAKFGADQAAINGDKVILGIRESRAKNAAEMFKGLETVVTKQYATPTPGVAGGGVAPNQDNVLYSKDGKPIAVLPQTGEAGKKNAELGNKLLATQRRMEANGAELEKLIGEGRTLPGTERSARMAGLQRQMLLDLKELKTMGALDKGAIEVSEDMIPSGAGAGGNGKAVLADFMKGLRQETQGRLSSFGVDGSAIMRREGVGGSETQKMSPAEQAKLRQEYTTTKDPGRRAAIARALTAAR